MSVLTESRKLLLVGALVAPLVQLAACAANTENSPTGDPAAGKSSTSGGGASVAGSPASAGAVSSSGGAAGASLGGASSAGSSAGGAGSGQAGSSSGCLSSANPLVPGASFDLSAWYLTLPTGKAGDPDDIYQPALATFVQEPYFYVNAECKLVFRAHAGGVTTSGSSYPRSELREMESDGTTKAAWSTAVGTHTLMTSVAIMHTPVVKADLVVNQIHDAEDDIVLVRLTGSELFVEGSVLDPSTGKPIKGQSMTYKTLEANYVLGTEFQTKIVAHDGSIDVYYNDMTTPAVTVNANVEGCYFKAGCYTHSNVSKGDAADAYGESQFSSISVVHE